MADESNGIGIIDKYFPTLPETGRRQMAQLCDLYTDWNAKINVISRKDIGQLYERHVLHSLAIAKFVRFTPGTHILDVGTGGGFPGIPLAIMFPECRFCLIDSIGKKIRVATEVAETIGLHNVELLHENVKEEKRRFDFVVSRAVMSADEMMKLTRKNVDRVSANKISNGWIFLKGGSLDEELAAIRGTYRTIQLSDYFDEPFFETKKIVYIPYK